MRVAFQGVRGAYSEEAAKKHFGACDAVGFPFSEQVVEAVDAGAVDAGILPVENSIAGPVTVNTDLFLKADVFAVAEVYLRIEHCLLGMPGAQVGDVWTVFSHPVALAQCREFLNKKGLKAVAEYDTAGSAELVAGRKRKGEAAIAPKGCAEAYGLAVLAENIQSARDNFTRFLVFVRDDKVPSDLKMEKTSLAFTAHHRPGALLDCLKRFADRGINLTKLESRPIPEDPFEYYFLVDVMGGLKDEGLSAALKDLERDAHKVKVLGSYPVGAR